MTHDHRDNRFTGGGQEYAPPPPPAHDSWDPQPVMRPAPQGYQAQPPRAPQGYAPPPAEAVVAAINAPQASPAAVAAATGAPVEDEFETVELSRAYTAHNETVRVLRFRKPSGADLRKYGYPIRQIINPDTGRVESIEINAAIAAKYIVALSTPPIPPSTIDAMSIHDADACNGAIVRFFLR